MRSRRLVRPIWTLAVAVATMMLSLTAFAYSGHYSSVHSKGDCGWSGYHEADSAHALASTTNVPFLGIPGCAEVGVKMWVNGNSNPVYDFDGEYARVSYKAHVQSFEYSDHNARPIGMGWWGFRMY